MKYIVLILIVLQSSLGICQNKKVDSLFIQFQKESFYEQVYPSKCALENYQKEVIPRLIHLVNDTAFVKLNGTADLIYPGAENYYGHGRYLPYAIDWISIRAGWLLEELTFQDFGYANKNTGNLTWRDTFDKKEVAALREIKAKEVAKWWQENKENWNRIEALKQALISNNENRIAKAIQILRYGETKCDGLTKEVYQKDIKPFIVKLKNSENDGIKEIAILLLKEN